MNRILKTALLWLLVLALPVQGFAAVIQTSCALHMQHALAMSASVSTAVSAEMPHAMAATQPVHAGMDEHSHQQMSMQSNLAADAQAQDSASTDAAHKLHKHADAKCSACMSCFTGVAMLPVMPELPVFPFLSATLLQTSYSLLAGHIPDGLKRPPKSPLV